MSAVPSWRAGLVKALAILRPLHSCEGLGAIHIHPERWPGLECLKNEGLVPDPLLQVTRVEYEEPIQENIYIAHTLYILSRMHKPTKNELLLLMRCSYALPIKDCRRAAVRQAAGDCHPAASTLLHHCRRVARAVA